MNSRSLSPVLALIALSALPLGACSLDSTQASEEVAASAAPPETSSLDPYAASDFGIVLRNDDAMPTEGYPALWSSTNKGYSPCPDAEDEPILVSTADEVAENDPYEDGAVELVLVSTMDSDETAQTAGEEDESDEVFIAEDADDTEAMEVVEVTEVVGLCDSELDESQFFVEFEVSEAVAAEEPATSEAESDAEVAEVASAGEISPY